MVRIYLMICVLLVAEGLHAEGVLDWNTAACRVIEYSCRMHNASDSYEAMESLKSQSLAFPNPVLSLGYDRYPQLSSNDANEYSVQVSQLFELGGKRCARHQLAESNANQAAWDWETLKISLMNELSHAFVRMAAADAEYQLAREQMQIADEIYQTLNAKAETGMASKTQVGRARLELATSQIALRKETQHLDLARVSLANVWHGEPDFETVDYPFHNLQPLASLDYYLSLIEERPDVASMAWNVESAYAAWELAKAYGVPDVVVSAGYNFTNDKQDNDAFFGVSLPLPIFDRNKGNINAASYQAQIAQREYNEFLFHLTQAVKAAYKRCQTSYEEALSLQELVRNDASEIYLQIQDVHNEGKIDYLSLLEAQRAFFDIKSSYIEAVAQFHNCRSDLEFLIAPEE